MSQTNEYRHSDGQTIGVVEGTEFDSVLSAEPAWELIATNAVEDPKDESPTDSEGPEVIEAPEAEDEESEDTQEIDPDDYTREELDAIAVERGVEDPKGLKSKAEVADAISAATTKEDSDDSE